MNPSSGSSCHIIAVMVAGFTGDYGLAALILSNAILRALNRSNIEYRDSGGMMMEPYAIQVIEARDKSAVFHCLHDELRGLGVISVAEFGYWDADEQYWRSVFPLGAEGLQRVVTPENIAKAKETERLKSEALLKKINTPREKPYNGTDGQ